MDSNMATVKFDTLTFLEKLLKLDLFQVESLLKGGSLDLHEFYFLSKDSCVLVNTLISISCGYAEITVRLTRMEESKPFAVNDKTYFNDKEDVQRIRSVLTKLLQKHRHRNAEILDKVSEKIKFEKFLKSIEG